MARAFGMIVAEPLVHESRRMKAGKEHRWDGTQQLYARLAVRLSPPLIRP
jgi:hypothetical protein